MSHRKRTHRHHRRQSVKGPVTSQAEISSQSLEINQGSHYSNLAVVAHDLKATALVTGLLIILLFLLAYLNYRTGWTLTFGQFLYRFLHIR